MKPLLKRFFTVLLASAAMIVVGAMLPPQLMTAAYAVDGVKYIDADGYEQTVNNVTEITSSNMPTSLGAGWYVVKDTVDYTSSITLNGDVHLILADGAALNIGKPDPDSRVNNDDGICGFYTIEETYHSYSLTVYGQENGTGALNVYVKNGSNYGIYGIQVDSFTVNGGHITVDSSDQVAINATNNSGQSGDPGVTVNGGELNANSTGIIKKAVVCENDSKFIFNGGKVKATGTQAGIQAEGGYYLDYRSLSDEITVSSFSCLGSPADIVNIANGKWFADDDGNAYSGSADITDKPLTLRPAFAVSIDGEISHGQVSANKAVAVSGNTVTLTITPEDEYELDLLSVIKPGSGPVETTGSGSKYEFTMPGETVTVYATFIRKTYSVKINGTSHGKVDVGNVASPHKGDTITLTATPDDGYKLDKITVTKAGGGTVETTGSGNKYEFTMPGEDVMVDATFIGTVSAPKFTPDGGTYTKAQNVTISSETSGADIYYTIDGSTPTKDSGKKYTGPISVAKNMTIKAIAVKEGMLNSEVTSAIYTINSVPPAKTYAVTVENGDGDGHYAAGATVTIKANAQSNGKVFDRWTTGDGVTFDNAESETTTFKMPAKSVTVKANYRDKNTVAAPLFSPDSGNYTSEQSVTISCSTEGAVIYYSIDGSTPTTLSTKYSKPISVTETTTIKAYAVNAGMTDSAISTAVYTIGEEPVITKYLVTVNNGTGGGEYEAGEIVTIKTDDPPEGKVFDKWTSEDGVTFVDAASQETSFTMPAKKVIVSATYKDKGKKEDDPDPNPNPAPDPDPNPGPNPDPNPNPDPAPNPSPDPNPNPNPDPEKPAQEKTPDKVPVTDPSTSTYASPEDNFAPVAPGSSEGTGGSIKKLELDFSKVKGSGVAPSGLKMTAITGSKFTTKAKVKDKNSVTTEGGVKAKFNKKDSTVSITCKKDGKATFETDDGTYAVEFKVEKPKPNKSEGKLAAGSGPVTKTVKDLFGTSIAGGKLTVLKEKVSGQATLSGNSLTINSAEKDTIKIQYQYLNKKYKMGIKVKW